jgi:Stigma-specific protein, Stig1
VDAASIHSDGAAQPGFTATIDGGGVAIDPIDTPIAVLADGTCPVGRKLCDGACVSRSDPAYGCNDGCGACKIPRATAGCSDGACVIRACDQGRADCNGGAENGCETLTASDGKHCGACNDACSAGQVCSNGTCSAACSSTLANCNGACVDLQNNDANCGKCGNSCGNSARCASGACACSPSCTGKVCGAPDGCGGKCAGKCKAGQRCVNGACECDAEICDGCCLENQCRVGTENSACGRLGSFCSACLCSTSRRCLAPLPTTQICAGETAVGLSVTCRDVCKIKGKVCGPGCFPIGSAIGYTTLARCAELTSPRYDCAEAVPVDNFANLTCCCG